MAKTVVYYFSGTGNTLYLAKLLSNALRADLVSIASTTGAITVRPEAEVIGIVYPVYYNDPPNIVREFAGKLRGIDTSYIFTICNYGGCGSQSVKSLEKIISATGGELTAAYGIHMPQNAFLKPWENNLKLLDKAALRIQRIAQDVKGRKKGNHLKGLLNFVFVWLHQKLIPIMKRDLASKTGLSPETSMEVLVQSVDKTFSVGEFCIGCGTCARVCPVGNIEMHDNKPLWQGWCENCLACYNWCPVSAIEGAIAKKDYFYKNPRISLEEMLAQQKKSTL